MYIKCRIATAINILYVPRYSSSYSYEQLLVLAMANNHNDNNLIITNIMINMLMIQYYMSCYSSSYSYETLLVLAMG